MSVTETRYEHVVLDEHGVLRIAATTMKVVELVTSQLAHGWSAEELAFQYPHLTLGQIHSALAYDWDHQQEMDADMERRLARVDALKESLVPSPLFARLRDSREAERESSTN